MSAPRGFPLRKVPPDEVTDKPWVYGLVVFSVAFQLPVYDGVEKIVIADKTEV